MEILRFQKSSFTVLLNTFLLILLFDIRGFIIAFLGVFLLYVKEVYGKYLVKIIENKVWTLIANIYYPVNFRDYFDNLFEGFLQLKFFYDGQLLLNFVFEFEDCGLNLGTLSVSMVNSLSLKIFCFIKEIFL